MNILVSMTKQLQFYKISFESEYYFLPLDF